MQISQTLFGNGSIMDYENRVSVAGPRSILYIIIKHVLAHAKDELRNDRDLHKYS